MQQVVTYQYAYVSGRVDLCDRHARRPPDDLPTLGPVSHGQHAGACDVCLSIEDKRPGDYGQHDCR